MHRWFRISAPFALVALPIFALTAELPALADDTAPAGATSVLPKHKNGGGLLQNLQDLVEQQKIEIDAQSKQIEALGKQVDAQNQSIENLNRQFTHLTELLESIAAHSAEAAAAAQASRAEPPRQPQPASRRAPAEAADGQTAPETPTAAEPSSPAAAETPAAASNPAPAAPGASTHVVKKGENLISIAHHYGTTASELLKLNKITDERKLQIGQTLILPAPATSASPAPSASSAPSPMSPPTPKDQ